MVSKRRQLDSTDWKKVLKGLALGAAGVVSVYLLEFIPTVNFGEWQAPVAAVCAVLANLTYKYLRGPDF